MEKKKFAAAALDSEYKTFVVHVTSLSSTRLVASLRFIPLDADVHPSCRPQISGLISKEALIKISNKYVNFVNVFSQDLTFKLPEHNGINNNIIKLVNTQRPPYGAIYCLGPVELEIWKAYIRTNLANGFIRSFKSPAGAFTLFN